jgi:hypothetical protein
VIAQKIQGGGLMEGSELILEVAEARLVDVTVDGSLLVVADNVMGHPESLAHSISSLAHSSNGSSSSGGGYSSWRAGSHSSNGSSSSNGHSSSSNGSRQLSYSSHNGRVHMMNVCVHNVGIDWHHPGNVYWQHRVQRHESCQVILRGRSEFEAYDCKLCGDQVGLGFWGGLGSGFRVSGVGDQGQSGLQQDLVTDPSKRSSSRIWPELSEPIALRPRRDRR